MFLFYYIFIFQLTSTNGRSDGETNSFFDWLFNNSDPIADEIAEVCL